MKKINRAAILAALSTALVIGSSVNGASAQATESDSDFNFTVVAKDLAYGEASFSIENRERLTVNGATQLTWWAPNHNVKVTNASLKKAPRIKVIYRACSVQSKSIAKQAKGASIVIAKPGSVICNTGKNGNIVGGFKWTVKVPAVLKWNKNLRLYEHVYNIVGGKLVKTCKNRMGGHVDVMYPSVVQVRYAQDVKESGKAVARAAVGGTVTFKITCPNGANFNTTVTTSAEAYASASIFFTERTRVSVLAAKKVELTHNLTSDGEAKALAKAETKIEVSGSCGDNPPPVTPKPDLVEIDTINDVLVNNSRTITVSGNTAPGHAGSLFCTARNGGSITAGKQQSVSGSFTKQLTYTAPSEVPGANAEYNIAAGRDRVDCTLTQDDGQKDDISTNQFEIRPAPVDPL